MKTMVESLPPDWLTHDPETNEIRIATADKEAA